MASANVNMRSLLFTCSIVLTYRVLVCLFMLGSVRGVRESFAAVVFAQEGLFSGVTSVVDFKVFKTGKTARASIFL